MWKTLIIGCALALGACAGSADGGPNDNCSVGMSFTPSMPVAGELSEVRVTSNVLNADGVRTYRWSVAHNGSVDYQLAQPDGSQITFLALTPGPYEVTLDVSVSSGEFCPQANGTVNVQTETGNFLDVRLHVTPPPGVDAPPIDRPLRIPAGADYEMGPVVLDPGIGLSGTITTGGTGTPAYVRLIPDGMIEAVVETYAGTNGTFTARVLNQPHDVIVIPTSSALAPRRLRWTPGQSTTFALDAGVAINGVVRDPAGNGLANAKVQLTIGGVPTTFATTTVGGNFTVRGVLPATTGPVKVEMTPPTGSGLPRLEATGTFNLSGSITIAYKNTVAVRNLTGTQVRRSGAPVPNAKVSIVGALSGAGTISGGVSVDATGYVRVTTTADGAGNLPAVFATAGPLSAVTTIGVMGDMAVSAFDTTSAVPATINAPPMVGITTGAKLGVDALDGARLELIPVGSLELAGAQTITLTSNAAGALVASIPSGGLFDARWSDPAARAGSELVADVTAADLQLPYTLSPALHVTGTLSVTGSPNKIAGASVQILCKDCNGIDRTRPLAEVASDQLGEFSLAVPDPGAM